MEDKKNSLNLQSNQSKILKLWINDIYYIPVNPQGECAGIVYEGALGYIIQILTERNFKYALKIPKLVGDTDRENIYINSLMENEYNTVDEIFGGGQLFDGLLNAFPNVQIHGKINTQGNPEAKYWHDSLIFTKYEKSQKPRFCLVKKNEDGTSEVFPPEAECPMNDEHISSSFYEKFENSQFQETNKKGVVLIEFVKLSQNIQSPVTLITINNEKIIESSRDIWCVHLPCVVYGWAPGTLQEAISLRKRGKWQVQHHLRLIKRLCLGLKSLHAMGMLHTDLRPANVIHRGTPTEPENYDICDYGSLAKSVSAFATVENTPEEARDRTIIGPVISGERSSHFYAPERRAGREREGADIAIIKYSSGTSYIFVILGWKDNLLDNNNLKEEEVNKYIEDFNEYYDQKNEEINQKKGKNLDESNENFDELQESRGETFLGLKKEDKIQVGEYIFELEADERKIKEKQILRCSANIWKVYQNRITIQTNAELEFQSGSSDFHYFSIARTIELLQWSAASDIFSLGALSLYSLYTSDSLVFNSESSSAYSKNNQIDIEEDFGNMLDQLSSIPYFQLVWPEIESLRYYIEYYLDNYNEKSELRKKNFKDLIIPINSNQDSSSDIKTLIDFTVEVTNMIVQTVPKIENLLESMDYDLGRFILFIHFILSCLHRQESLIPEDSIENSNLEQLPFSAHRSEGPEAGAAQKAFARLEKLYLYLNNSLLNNLKINSVERRRKIPGYNPKSDTRVRLEYLEKVKQLEEKEKQLQEMQSKFNEIQKALKQVKEHFRFLAGWRSREVIKNIEKLLTKKSRND